MTNPDQKAVSDISKIVEALEQVQAYLPEADDRAMHLSDLIYDALPLANSIAEQWDELVEVKAALEWFLTKFPITTMHIDMVEDCPAIIKRMIGEKHE